MKKMSHNRPVRAFLVAAAGIGAAFAASGVAADPGPMPDDYEEMAVDYVKSRLTNPRGARVTVLSEPYEVEADFDDMEDEDAWAVDVRVRSRLPSGARHGSMAYTVIFYDGEPVALQQDGIDLARL